MSFSTLMPLGAMGGRGGKAFSPADLGNLAVCLESDNVVASDGDAVFWTDILNNKLYDQATGSKKPTFKTNIINDHPVLRFTGASAQWLRNTTIALGPNISIYAVASWASGNGYQRIISNENNLFFGKGTDTGKETFCGFYGNGSVWGTVAPYGAAATLYQNTFQIFESINNGTDTAYINGGASVLSRSNPMAAFSDGLWIGGDGQGNSQYWNGDVAAIYIFNAAHTDSERNKMQAFLAQKYGLALWPIFVKAAGPVVALGADGSWDDGDIANPDIFYDTPNNRWAMNYSGHDGAVWRTGLAYSTDLAIWTKDLANNPILNSSAFFLGGNGSIVLKNGVYYFYHQTSDARITLSTSSDLTNWTHTNVATIDFGAPGAFDETGAFDPMVRLLPDGTIELFYCGKDAAQARAFGRATSSDGTNFTKHGRLFGAADVPFVAGSSGFGEPCAVFDDPNRYAILFDAGGGNRFISMGITLDGGVTWVFRKILEKSGSTWEKTQVFDNCTKLIGTTLYIYYAGSDLIGDVAGMHSQVGFATYEWGRSTLIA